jgi:hypothetical protein
VASKRPDWATHEGIFCGIVPIWFKDEEGDGCTIVGKNWFADRVLLPVVETLFALGAMVFGWEAWPMRIRELPRFEADVFCFCCGNWLDAFARQGFCLACADAGCPTDNAEVPCRLSADHGEKRAMESSPKEVR